MEEIELAPTAMAAGGAAIARDDDGRVVFVDGALPGERVRARLFEAKNDFARAVTVEVVEPCEDRIAPPCPAVSAGCGGCSWLHVRPEAQWRLKAAVVTDALRRIGRFAPDDIPPVGLASRGGPPNLRTTARLGVGADGRAGHRHRRGHEVVAPADCAAVHPLVEEILLGGRFPGADEVVMRVGVASGERAVLTTPGGIEAVVPPDVVVGDRAIVHEEVAGAWLQVSIGSFFQPGPMAAAALVEAVREAAGDALGRNGHLVDAYAGVGLFGATVGAGSAARVTAIESSPEAVADARVNLAALDAVVVEGEMGRWHPRQGDPAVDVVVADPARSGLGKPGVAAVARAGAPRVVLVSCDPASLGRDARLLAQAGYRLSTLDLVDAFPGTYHSESVARFDRIAEISGPQDV